MTAPLTPRERVRRLFIKLDKDDECDWSAIVQFKKLSDQLAAEIEEANRRREAAERQLARYREKYGELE